MKNIRNFFIFCSGANFSLLKKCPTEENKYLGIGGTVLFTGILASLSGGYALYSVFDNAVIAAGFGLLWGFMIFNLDRYIVSSMKKNSTFLPELKMALPRFFLATLLALVISKPLELRVFEKEINNELVNMEQAMYKRQEDNIRLRFAPAVDSLYARINQYKNELGQKAARRDSLLLIAQQEADGTGGSKVKNLGPIYTLKKADADKAEAELRETESRLFPEISLLETGVKLQDSISQATLGQLKKEGFDGIAGRLEALSRLGKENRSIMWAGIFITLLFITIEITPVLVKLLSPRGPYDDLLDKHEHTFVMAKMDSLGSLTQATQEKLEMIMESGRQRLDSELAAHGEMMESYKKARLEVAENIIAQWKEDQLKNLVR